MYNDAAAEFWLFALSAWTLDPERGRSCRSWVTRFREEDGRQALNHAQIVVGTQPDEALGADVLQVLVS